MYPVASVSFIVNDSFVMIKLGLIVPNTKLNNATWSEICTFIVAYREYLKLLPLCHYFILIVMLISYIYIYIYIY